MRRLTFPLAFLVLLALCLVLSSCGDDGPAAEERWLDAPDITVQKGPAVGAIFPIGGGGGGDGGQALQTELPAIGITGTGYGKATAPADTAVVQFAVSAWPPGYGPALACGDCTPLPTARAIDVGDLLTVNRLRTVVDAIVAAGGDRDSVEISVDSVPAPPVAYNITATGRISVTVRDIANVAAVAQAGTDAIAALTEIDAALSTTSVIYEVTDCAALRGAAGLAAAEDAADTARATAALLGLGIGAIVGASDYTNQAGYQQAGESDCSVSGGSISFTPGVGLTAPPSDVEVSAQISVTYAIK